MGGLKFNTRERWGKDVLEVLLKIVVGDIGGTKTNVALYTLENNQLTQERMEVYPSAQYPSLLNILLEFMKDVREEVEYACFGLAGIVQDRVCITTNLPWHVDSVKLEETFKFKRVELLNDLVANAWGIQELGEDQFVTLNKGIDKPGNNRALISVGTGLGVCPIYYYKDMYIPSPSEGGHADFAPRNEREVELWRFLRSIYGTVSKERVLCGKGLAHIYYYLTDRENLQFNQAVKEQMEGKDPAEVVTHAGLNRECKACIEAIDWFCTLYGAEAGNLALSNLATGGVFIGGGVAPKLLRELKGYEFMDGFKGKGRFEELLANIPVKVMLNDQAAMLGAAAYCRDMMSGE
ncbi:MAG: Glucokinase [Chlamydiia bacterium]|nr:Glucokinase [Chlamydiia bacterium]